MTKQEAIKVLTGRDDLEIDNAGTVLNKDYVSICFKKKPEEEEKEPLDSSNWLEMKEEFKLFGNTLVLIDLHVALFKGITYDKYGLYYETSLDEFSTTLFDSCRSIPIRLKGVIHEEEYRRLEYLWEGQ